MNERAHFDSTRYPVGFLGFVAVATLLAGSAEVAAGCPYIEPDGQETIPIALPGDRQANLRVSYNEFPIESVADGSKPAMKKECNAAIQIPLSAFPTARVASRPSEFAPRLTETMRKWEADSCRITVWLEDDTGDELSMEERCTIGEFGFEGDRVLSLSSEVSCVEVYEIIDREESVVDVYIEVDEGMDEDSDVEPEAYVSGEFAVAD